MRTLLTGYADAFTERIIGEYLGADVYVCHESGMLESPGTTPGDPSGYDRLFDTYDFEQVVYVSKALSHTDSDGNELIDLDRCLSAADRHGGVRFAYVGSNLTEAAGDGGRGRICGAYEGICEHHSRLGGTDVTVVRSPYLASPWSSDDIVHRLTSQLQHTGHCVLPGPPQQMSNTMSASDLARFLRSLFADWRSGAGTIALAAPKPVTYSDVRSQLHEIFPASRIEFSGSAVTTFPEPSDGIAHDFYHWEPSSSPLSDIRSSYGECLGPVGKRTGVSSWIHAHRSLVIAAEVVAGAVIAHALSTFPTIGTRFSFIDYRLVYITMISIAYGTAPGVVAAGLMSLSLLAAYSLSGSAPPSFSSDASLWAPFVFYFALASATGYFSTSQRESTAFAVERNHRLTERFDYIYGLYREALRTKSIYRSELVSSHGGFGKAYDVVRRLSVLDPGEILRRCVPVIEDVLDCDRICVYTVDGASPASARLVARSYGMRDAPATIDLRGYGTVLDGLSDDDVWFNRSLASGLPDYVACIRHDGAIRVLVTISDVGFEQKTAYYLSRIKVVIRMIGNFLTNAWRYQSAGGADRLCGAIMSNGYLNRQLGLANEAQDGRVSTYRLLRIRSHGMAAKELDDMLSGYVRGTDVLGMGRDGDLYLIAYQVDESGEGALLDRFRSLGLDCEIVRFPRGRI